MCTCTYYYTALNTRTDLDSQLQLRKGCSLSFGRLAKWVCLRLKVTALGTLLARSSETPHTKFLLWLTVLVDSERVLYLLSIWTFCHHNTTER